MEKKPLVVNQITVLSSLTCPGVGQGRIHSLLLTAQAGGRPFPMAIPNVALSLTAIDECVLRIQTSFIF